MAKILVAAGDIIPLPGCPTTGAGLRAWGLGQGLISQGHEVVFSIPAQYLNSGYSFPAEITANTWYPNNFQRVVNRVKPDLVIFCHWPTVQIERRLDVPTVLDFHGPHLLEREIQGFGVQYNSVVRKLEAIRQADFFTCAGERQRFYFLSWLMAAGIEQAGDRIHSIPISFSPDIPSRQWGQNPETLFVYGGIFLPWQDPSVILEALVETMDSRGQGRLNIYGGRHPIYGDQVGNLAHFDRLLQRVSRSQRVAQTGLMSNHQLIDTYLQADVAVDAVARNPERELAFTTRTVEYLWCGLPVIYHHYAELSDYIQDYQAGWIVNPANPDTVKSALTEIFDRPDLVAERGRNGQKLVRDKFCWDKTIVPLADFVRHPTILPITEFSVGHQRNLHYLLNEAKLHYRQGGFGDLWRESWSFLRRKTRI